MQHYLFIIYYIYILPQVNLSVAVFFVSLTLDYFIKTILNIIILVCLFLQICDNYNSGALRCEVKILDESLL